MKFKISKEQWKSAGKKAGWIKESGTQTFDEIKKREDPDGKSHDLTLVCVNCGDSQTCRCGKPKREFKGVCNKCASIRTAKKYDSIRDVIIPIISHVLQRELPEELGDRVSVVPSKDNSFSIATKEGVQLRFEMKDAIDQPFAEADVLSSSTTQTKFAKWDEKDVVNPKEKGKYEGRTQESLRKQLKTLTDKQEAYKNNHDGKANPEYTDVIRELNFALRSKTGWGEV